MVREIGLRTQMHSPRQTIAPLVIAQEACLSKKYPPLLKRRLLWRQYIAFCNCPSHSQGVTELIPILLDNPSKTPSSVKLALPLPMDFDVLYYSIQQRYWLLPKSVNYENTLIDTYLLKHSSQPYQFNFCYFIIFIYSYTHVSYWKPGIFSQNPKRSFLFECFSTRPLSSTSNPSDTLLPKFSQN